VPNMLEMGLEYNKYIAFLRAVNVGGTGKLPMPLLKQFCEDLNFSNVKTYIASGNVIFKTNLPPNEIKQQLEAKLEIFFTKKIEVFIRDINQMREILVQNPFEKCAPNRVICNIIDDLPNDVMNGIKNQKQEEIIKTQNAIFIHYGEGMADSRLLLPWFKMATGRNINTITKIVAMLEEL
jgi:uncharacterized protein (DUF1697 family)